MLKKNFYFYRWIINFIVLIFLLVSLGICETIKNTQEAVTSKRFTDYMSSNLPKRLYQCAVLMDHKLGVKSKDSYNITLGNIVVIMPIEFSDDAIHPLKGLWMNRYKLKRAGKVRTYNVYFFAQQNAEPRAIPSIMGESNADLVLLKDTLPSVYASVYVSNKLEFFDKEEFDKTVVIADSYVVEPPHDVFDKGKIMHGVWIEEWIVRACGKDVPVKITFIPDDDGRGGTTFMVKVKDEWD